MYIIITINTESDLSWLRCKVPAEPYGRGYHGHTSSCSEKKERKKEEDKRIIWSEAQTGKSLSFIWIISGFKTNTV